MTQNKHVIKLLNLRGDYGPAGHGSVSVRVTKNNDGERKRCTFVEVSTVIINTL